MVANRGTDTGPELAIRRILHRRGMRFRVNMRPIPNLRRTGDIVFTRWKVAVYIDGCFWHGCPVHYVPPKTNAHYWAPKIRRNVERDAETNETMRLAGWTTMRFWSHQSPAEVAQEICVAIGSRRQGVHGRLEPDKVNLPR
ncbi:MULTISPECIES: very short patch repair endonuclease [Cryobacterium]|uniref:very short patch repair endonuclease n=1 Tax=Cryobacterium TaxID=69578 RepID=UPI001F54687F|nr:MULTISPECIES: very short patch repair endonuclease [Cryobacterium]